ncbi:Haem-binding domain-containing protein [Filimonas lacunae]|uniref:Haem-binding domain-containing protein n=1 Tax=Filimonas lacunae TaxID=477680 RepID=A0A173MH30_9BACT|nr:cytochrome P460 family protein [Filimonas lacunae]BAV06913.1 cytochrome p460 [Filimonas lacunae]SIS97935.1 Haem-binding domain-containing protein [Filimonas lacunae]
MKKAMMIVIGLIVATGVLQLFRPEKVPSTPAANLAGVPPEVNRILRTSCFDCHSSEVNLRWYDQLSPASFLVNKHVLEGRKAFNFSGWDSLPTPAQNNMLYYALNQALANEMPLPSYTMVHGSASLSAEDKALLKQYIFSRTPRKTTDTTQLHVADKQYEAFVNGTLQATGKVKPAPNEIAYIPDYRNWKMMSTTDRFDNGTVRMIYANDIAVKAIEEHHTKEWPDGAVFAKAAWKEQVNADGSVTAGAFWQVEFMIKDAGKYAQTAGWGWARWRGDDLKPYGANAAFTQECVSCHQPMKGNDYVFTKPLNLFRALQQKR